MYRIEIPNYITHIELTKKRRPVYKEDGTLKNARTVNKPRVKKINGQDLWVTIDPHLRSKIAKELKKYFYEFIREMPEIEEYPLKVLMEFHQPAGDYDIDNLSLWYRKCFHDALAGNVEYIPANINGKVSYYPDRFKYPAKIIDDNVNYISEFTSRFVEAEPENNKLIIVIEKA